MLDLTLQYLYSNSSWYVNHTIITYLTSFVVTYITLMAFSIEYYYNLIFLVFLLFMNNISSISFFFMYSWSWKWIHYRYFSSLHIIFFLPIRQEMHSWLPIINVFKNMLTLVNKWYASRFQKYILSYLILPYLIIWL